jgi:hypothetical protein
MSIERYFNYPSQTVEYVSNISDRYKAFYLANPKAASTGILRTMQLAEVDGDKNRVPESVHDRAQSPLLNFSTSSHSPDEILGGADFFRFTYVRNPFSRVLSAYLDKIVADQVECERLLPTLGMSARDRPSFLSFLKAVHAQRDGWRDIHWTTQKRLVQINNVAYSFIGRFESFGESFPVLVQRLGIPSEYVSDVRPAHATNATARVNDFVGDDERELILAIYEADFQAFGYGHDPNVADL